MGPVLHTQENPLNEFRLSAPRRRGRPKTFDEATCTTTVRVTRKDWEWAKSNRLEFSAMLRSKIHQLQQAEALGPQDPKARLVVALREAGFNGERIGEILSEAK